MRIRLRSPLTRFPARGPLSVSALRGDRGSATAETAIVLPMVVALLVVLLGAGLIGAAQISVDSAARAGARELARGEPESSAAAAAQRIAGPGAQVRMSVSGEWASVEVQRRLALPGTVLSGAGVTVSARAESRREPHLLESGIPAGGMGLLLLGRLPRGEPQRRVEHLPRTASSRRACPRRTARTRQSLRGEAGSAPAAVIAWTGTTAVMLGALMLLLAGHSAAARADTAADLSALAAADAAAVGREDPCAVAAEVADRNGSRLSGCRLDGGTAIIQVQVESAAPIPPALGTARAGPAPAMQGLPPVTGGGSRGR